MWIAYPVTIPNAIIQTTWLRAGGDFFRDAPAISKSFSSYGRPGHLLTQSYQMVNQTKTILAGHLYLIRGIGAVVVLKFPRKSSLSLVRPNMNMTVQVLAGLGLSPNAALITETLVCLELVTDQAKLRFAVTPTTTGDFVIDEVYPRFLATLVIERLILDLSLEKLSSRHLTTRTARKLGSTIRFWISSPAIESESLRKQFQEMRTALDLDNRSAETYAALEEINKLGNAALLSGSAATASLLTLTDFINNELAIGWYWAGVSLVVGAITWALVRGFRI